MITCATLSAIGWFFLYKHLGWDAFGQIVFVLFAFAAAVIADNLIFAPLARRNKQEEHEPKSDRVYRT